MNRERYAYVSNHFALFEFNRNINKKEHFIMYLYCSVLKGIQKF